MLRFGRAAVATAVEESAVLVVCRDDAPSAAFSFSHEHRSTPGQISCAQLKIHEKKCIWEVIN